MKICDYDYFFNKIYDYDYDYSIFVIDYDYAITITQSDVQYHWTVDCRIKCRKFHV